MLQQKRLEDLHYESVEIQNKKMISFIIPCYNEEKYIRDCITAIKKELQQYDNCEIIVVDNGSTDKTVDIALSEGVLVIREPKKGVVHARQRGYENAKYELIANIDADSQIPKDWIKTALNSFENDTVAVTGPLIYTDVSKFTNLATKIFYIFAMIINNLGAVFVQGGNCIIKKKYLDNVNGYDTSIAFYGEDTMTARRLKQFGKIKFNRNLFIYSSPRRLKSQGLLNTTILYLVNYLYVTLKNKSFSNDYKDHR